MLVRSDYKREGAVGTLQNALGDLVSAQMSLSSLPLEVIRIRARSLGTRSRELVSMIQASL